ncbi:MAG: roadblock/LC7 domain-containing protein [Planctomycetota bacterium]|jgi:predicted regulator of Ras-like GTPase activity (Roadblock/LC7/MglB family)
MEAVLDRLEKEAWVRGSMIVSDEGMVVVERLGGDLDRDAVAALASDLVTEVADGLREAGVETFKRIVLSATAGELVVVGCGSVYLVVIAAAGSEAFYIEIDSAAQQLRRLAPSTSMRGM